MSDSRASDVSRRRRQRSRGRSRFGTEKVVRRERVEFDADQLSALAALLGGAEPADPSSFAARLSAIATDYRAAAEQRSQASSRATINASLLDLRERTDALADRLECLDIAAEMELIVARLRMGEADNPRWKRNLVDALGDLSDMLRSAHDSSAVRRGPAGNMAIDRAALRLMVLFNEFAGHPATHNPYDNLAYTGAPMSAAGRFVLAVFRMIDPGVTPQRVSSALARAVKEMKRG
ncbi:MAG: hypothetical protein ACU0B1_01470 [Thermohalobaculum sp.]